MVGGVVGRRQWRGMCVIATGVEEHWVTGGNSVSITRQGWRRGRGWLARTDDDGLDLDLEAMP